MTIPSTARKAGPFIGTDLQTAWPFTFKVFAEGDITVTIRDTAGVESVAVLDTDFSVALNADQGTSPGGTITYPIAGDALVAGAFLTITGNIDLDQSLNLPGGGNFSPGAIENALDRIVMQSQQISEITNRGVRFPVSDAELGPELPIAELRALKALVFDEDGNVAVGTDDYNDQASNSAASAESAAASAAAALVIATQFGDVEVAIDAAEAAATDATAQAVIATTQAGIATDEAGTAADEAVTSTAQAVIATDQAVLATSAAALADAAKVAAEAARDAAIAGDYSTWPTTAAGIGSGLADYASLVAGSGGTNGTFALGFSGGTQVLAPVGVFTVAGGALVSIILLYPGYYSAGTPTLVFTASAGLTGASATAVMATNTPVNDFFLVPSIVIGEAAIGYKNVAGVATESFRLASAAAVLMYDFFPNKATAIAVELAAMARIKKFELYGADPTKFYSLKYFFWKDSGTRANITIVQHTDSSGTGVVEVCSYSLGSGADVWVGPREITLTAVGGSGITGTVIADFTDPTALTLNNASSSGAIYQRRGINTKVIATSTARATDISDRITAAQNYNATLTGGLKQPFADVVSNDFIRLFVKDAYVYGADPTHVYIFSEIEIQDFRVTFVIYDLTAAKVVCKTAYTAAIPDYTVLPTIWKLDQGALAGVDWDGMYAVCTFDWAQATTGTRNYTLAAESAIHSSKVFNNDMVADYLQRDLWHETIKVGPGETYTDLPDMLLAQYASGTNRKCHRAHYHHQVLVDVAEGIYHLTFRNIPDWFTIRGQSGGRTLIIKEDDTSNAMAESHGPCKWFNLSMFSDSTADLGQYCLHMDDANGISVQNGLVAQQIRQSFNGLNLSSGPDRDAIIVGVGIASDQIMVFKDVVANHENPEATAAAFFFHNNGPTAGVPTAKSSLRSARVIMDGCRSNANHLKAVELQNLETGPLCTLQLHNCDFSCITETIANGPEVVVDEAADRFGWSITGVHTGPIVRVDVDGSIVLATTPGLAVTGTAAALIFGTVDELGRGDKWVLTGTTKCLGARLGDCSGGGSKTLIIAGETCTFNTNLTAASNATILAQINAALIIAPVTEVDIQKEFYHDTGYHRRMLNSTGATIPKRRFVKKTSTNTIALAQPGDVIFGWIYRDILDGLAGTVVTTKDIHYAYIGGAGADGEFGISSITPGLLSYSATVKVGNVSGGIVHLYK